MTVKVFRKSQAIEALKDVKTWLLFAISFCVSAPNVRPPFFLCDSC